MIKTIIGICKKNKEITRIEVNGHANSAPEGKDLVCAAVSAIVTGGINNLEELKSFEISMKKGDVKIYKRKPTKIHDNVVLETIVTGLKTIQESNPNFIQIEEIEND